MYIIDVLLPVLYIIGKNLLTIMLFSLQGASSLHLFVVDRKQSNPNHQVSI